ncbi:4-hydroxy-tetrahydrodipicolinate synthase [Stella humosa]|uniref:4-hydroxy-tetrahydrodipicolinate synthase n=1 Tax=Stella humosa TaxID=94 RepID=A0A3N1KSS7_9PROT|nr:dihydrodipicolinate synthase family protein [Stella humosa]ROP81440.1 4-hydroxy-tetrahydrodipicolinate synthase [Stella humosa]BBK32792.1 dihydrodipicolinate synthase family protein [Stella humosa]
MILNDVVVATILPFAPDLSIDWAGYERFLGYCVRPGISAVFVNGHAGEGASLTPDERVEVIRRTRAVIGRTRPLLAGIIAYSTAEAVRQAREARDAGAEVAVLFPLPQFAGGGAADPAVVLDYVDRVIDGAGLPVSVFQYPIASGLGFSTPVLVDVARRPGVLAIKEGSGDIRAYEENWRAVKQAAPEVAILASNFDWFLAQAAIGADGILSGLASLTPDLLVELWRAAQAGDLRAMRQADDRLHPVVRAIYGARPLMDMHTRIKVALRHLGVIGCALPRPPLLAVAEATERVVTETVDRAGLRAALAV